MSRRAISSAILEDALDSDLQRAGGACELTAMRSNSRKVAGAKLYSLTAREIEVLTWVASGKSAWEIGEILHIAKRTVDEHVQTAVRKMGAVNRTHAVALAIRERIIAI